MRRVGSKSYEKNIGPECSKILLGQVSKLVFWPHLSISVNVRNKLTHNVIPRRLHGHAPGVAPLGKEKIVAARFLH
jgi:hypothetical protein